MKLLENPVFHNRLKHIDMRYHYIKDMVYKGVVRLQYIPTNEQIADVLAKPLAGTKFIYFRDKLSMTDLAKREC